MTQIKKGTFNRKLLATAILAPMILVAGCSDNDGSPLPSEQLPTGETSGFAYDGYLVGATVCVDVNLNKACDADEPSTTTGEGGQFELVALTEAQLLTPLVLEANENTVDEDTGEAVDPNLKFLAPAGSKAVSALSTVIQVKVEQAIAAAVAAGEEFSLENLKTQATNELADQLGVSGTDLTSFDPIAETEEGATNGDKLNAAKLHLANKVLSQQIATLIPDATAIASANSLSETAAVTAAIASLDIVNVEEAVRKYASGTSDPATIGDFTADDVAGGGDLIAPEVDVTDLEAAAEIESTVQDAIEAEIEEEVNAEPTGATGGTGS